MTAATQLDLLSSVEPVCAEAPSGRQHRLVLVALWLNRPRGCTGEECALRAGIRLTTTATTRLEELADRDRFGVPLVAKSDLRRSTSSGRLASIWFLTDAGSLVAGALAEEDA